MTDAMGLRVALSKHFLFLTLGGGIAFAQTPGSVAAQVVTAKDPQQSYALYLPSKYTPTRKWPIIYAFDPGARGRVPVELFRDAAEKYGYIVAGSNNSQNGPTGPELEAAEAMAADTRRRFSVDPKRIYLAGFSGGARLATNLALHCNCAAGIFASGAGFPEGTNPSKATHFLFFGTVGVEDFNYPEMATLGRQLDDAGFISRIEQFDGGHQWAPAGVAMGGVEWFELHAMRAQMLAADPSFIQRQFAKTNQRARDLQAAGDVLAASNEFAKLLQDYAGSADTGSATQELASLRASKLFKDALKHQQREFDQQRSVSSDLIHTFTTLHSDSDGKSDAANTLSLRSQLKALAETTGKDRTGQDARVKRRVLASVSIHIFETEQGDMRTHDYEKAGICLEVLGSITKNPAGLQVERAAVYALSGDKKRALSSLREARRLGYTDAEELRSNPGFATLRDGAEFRQILAEMEMPPKSLP